MADQFKFTQERIAKLTTPEAGRVEYFDTEQKKLRLRVSSTGAKSFAVVKKVNGSPKRVTIGQWPEVSIAQAREEAGDILAELRKGVDPTAKKRDQKQKALTLQQVFNDYKSKRKLKPTTISDYTYKLEHYFSDWLDKPVSKITEKMVLKRQQALTAKGATTANTAMRVLRLTLNYASAIGAVDNVATDILSKARMWHKNERKSRVIPSNKLQDWHRAVESLRNQKAKVYLFMLLYMGMRSSEALGLKWENVDLVCEKLTLIDTKNGTNHTLPIPNVLMPMLKRLQAETGRSKWVYASSDLAKPMWTPKKPIAQVSKHSGVEFSPHDCRRTFATIAEAVNLPLTMIKRLMNHTTSNEVTGGYIITEEETLREAINKVATYIKARVDKQDNVIKLAR